MYPSTERGLEGDSVEDRYLNMLETGIFYDMILEVIDEENNNVVRFASHRSMIATGSSVMGSHCKYSDEKSIIQIRSHSAETITMILYFFYTGKVPFTSLKNCLKVISAAQFYMIPDIQPACVNYITNALSQNVIDFKMFVDIMNTGCFYNLPKVLYPCYAYLEDKPSILESEEILELSVVLIFNLLQINFQLCSEETLFKVFCKWALHNRKECSLSQMFKKLDFPYYFRLSALDGRKIPFLIDQCLSGKEYELSSDDALKIHLMYLNGLSNPYCYNVRGPPNENNSILVFVAQPPFEIVEEFEYIGGVMPIFSIHLVPKQNSLIRTFAGIYEEHVTFKVHNFDVNYEPYIGLVKRPDGLTYYPFTQVTQFPYFQNGIVRISVVFNRPGIYNKITDTNSMYSFNRKCPGVMTLRAI